MDPQELRLLSDPNVQLEVNAVAHVWIMYGKDMADRHWTRTMQLRPRDNYMQHLMFEAAYRKVVSMSWMSFKDQDIPYH